MLGDPFVLALDQRSSGFHEAAGLKSHNRHNRGLKAALAGPPLNPTIRPLTATNLRNQPSAGAPIDPPKGEAQGIPKQPAAFSGAGGRQIGRANANALAAEGNAGEDYGAGWWRNQWARAVIWVKVSKPWSNSGVGWTGEY